jgi:translocation and assembly module TamB
VHAEIAATPENIDVRNGKIALARNGSIAFDAHAPLGQGTATPIALDFAPRNVDVSAYVDVLPDNSVVGGLLDGRVSVRGTRAAPQLGGALTFTNGSFKSDSFKNALTDIALDLELSGTSVRVARLHAVANPGSIDGSGTLALRDLRDPLRGLAANVEISVARAYFALPKYYSGTVDGQLTMSKRVANPLTLAGNVTLSGARIPYTALLPSGGTTTSAAPALPAVAFDVGVNVTRDVRVQSGPVDIGTTGSARLGGTLAKPTLDGQFTATNGTVSLYRTFNVQNGSAVTFNPSDGVTPSVDATAVTNVPDPPTDVLLHVTGLADHLQLAFSSQPPYSEQQILGLLVGAQALGAVSGVAQSSDTGGVSIAGIGEGVLNTQLTQKFLQPFSSALGGALGLSNLNLGYSTNGSVSATAQRRIGKNVSFVYSQQVGGTNPRASFGINVGNSIAGAQLTFFQTTGAQQAFGGEALTPYQNSAFLSNETVNYTLQAIAPPTGSGFVFSYQRHYW